MKYMKEKDLFESTDIALVSTIYYFGRRIEAIDKSNPARAVFVFERDKELDELKANSFKNLNDNYVKTLHPEGEKRHRRTKAEMEAEKLANSTTTNTGGATETIQQ